MGRHWGHGVVGVFGVTWGAVGGAMGNVTHRGRCGAPLCSMGSHGSVGRCEGLWGAMGRCGVSMELYGVPWVTMGCCEVLWGATERYGVTMGRYGSLWGQYGALCGALRYYGSLWGAVESLWDAMG